jgi:hypothetical protein
MSIVYTGDISKLSTVLKNELDKISKISIDFIYDDVNEQITIPISQDIDIYTSIKEGVINIFVFTISKKNKQSSELKNIIINYKLANTYSILIANKQLSNISKNVKKQKLEMIAKLDNNRILFKLANKYLLVIDGNGFFYYYPDSIQTISLNSWIQTDTLSEDVIKTFLTKNSILTIDCKLDHDAYNLYDFPTLQLIHSDNVKNIDNVTNDEHNQNINNSANDYSRLGYLLSWFNPLAYYSSNSISSNTSSGNSTNYSNNNKLIKLENEYYLDTKTSDIIKIENNIVKTLKLTKIDIPVFITDININSVDEVILSGRIDEKPINMKFNKYLINMLIC